MMQCASMCFIMFMFDINTFDFFFVILGAYTVFILSFPFLKRIVTGKYFSVIFATFLFLITFTLLSLLNNVLFLNKIYYFNLSNFFNNEYLINFIPSFSLNRLSYSFALLVTVIGLATNIYILNYFRGEADESGFIFWINAFIISMLLLVLATNFFTLFFGWELIGLSSFFLINFWQAKRSTLKSSFKAFTFNLVSDIFLLASFIVFYYHTGATDCETFSVLLLTNDYTGSGSMHTGAFFLVMCCAIKSVQFFGHLWLPDSMEAPVPASSLIHSATLVSAGIYLLCKFNVLFVLLGWTPFLLFLGAFTAAYGAVVASSQTDLKKLLAYSTMSHCGFLWVTASIGSLEVTILYLFLHGLFKAATFYCVGTFIRAYGTQDSRWMGTSVTYYPADTLLLILSALNLAGLPFSLGAFYKTYFFKVLLLSNLNYLTLGLLVIGMLGSLVYFFRLVFYTCFDFLKTVKNLPLTTILTNVIKIEPAKTLSFNHFLSISLLLSFSMLVVNVFYWYLNVNLLDFDIQPSDSSWFIFSSLSLEKVYVAYLILFYFLYFIIGLTLLIIFYRPNSYAFQLTCLILTIFVTVFFLICEDI